MKTLRLVPILASVFLTACAAHSPRPNNADPFLQPTVIEGPYSSLKGLMADPNSATRDLIDFGGNAEDAVLRCNDDKAAAKKQLEDPQ